ncbi:hypothetical protein AB1K54_12065 [Microbacterium sp. BWT-B31]|uniref:hypothetical protein n=1 Tax=Microbacterium sp. BWT-B31 TaxID=3232072 RepID=UPI0035291D48
MTPDLLDDLLDRSAPTTSAVRDDDLRAMMRAARREGRMPRRRRIAVMSGALALVLAGGAGVATATDGFGAWGIQDPVGAVPFTMANGFDCELRYSGFRAGADFAGDPGLLAETNRVLEDWYRSTDVAAEAQKLLPEQRDKATQSLAAAMDGDPGADMSSLSPQERAEEVAHRAWSVEWFAWDLVVAELEDRALRDAGISQGGGRFAGAERSSQIQCFDESGKPYVPGASE